MKIFRIALVAMAGTALALSAFAFFDTKRVKVESTGNRVYKKVDHNGRVRLTKRLSDKPCVFGRSWGYDRNGIWVDDGCRAEFEYETDGRGDDDRWPIGGGGSGSTKRIKVESSGGKRTYYKIDTSGGVRLTKRLSDAPCTLGRSWGYDRNGVWVDNGCRAEFEVKTRDGSGWGGGSGNNWTIDGRPPRWAVGTWRGLRRSAQGLELTIRSDGTLYLRRESELTEGRRGQAGRDRVRIGDDFYKLELEGSDQLKLTPLRAASGTMFFDRR